MIQRNVILVKMTVVLSVRINSSELVVVFMMDCYRIAMIVILMIRKTSKQKQQIIQLILSDRFYCKCRLSIVQIILHHFGRTLIVLIKLQVRLNLLVFLFALKHVKRSCIGITNRAPFLPHQMFLFFLVRCPMELLV